MKNILRAFIVTLLLTPCLYGYPQQIDDALLAIEQAQAGIQDADSLLPTVQEALETLEYSADDYIGDETYEQALQTARWLLEDNNDDRLFNETPSQSA